MKNRTLFGLRVVIFISLLSWTSSAASQVSSGPNPEFLFVKTQGGILPGLNLGTIRFTALNNSSYVHGAQIQAKISGNLINGILPTKLLFLTGDETLQERLVITERGYIGVNSDSPLARLTVRQYSDVLAPNDNILFVEGGSSSNRKSFQIYNDNNFSNALQAKLEGNLFVTNGKVAIGTENITGDHLLYVNGGILSTQVKVSYYSNWPDYVFKPDYSLMPLDKLEEYIKANSHLPNIPSADQIKEEGIDVAQMQAKLLEKIEELTIYIIAMEKEIKNLRDQINAPGTQK